ncbi:MAG: redox-regulated ATPase YchF [Devosia nanyangense]|uniref:Ribosome-binding ATPase YchF n=1 Tax=Devosia nanyangense TaxID=1228055 RepID=A0A933L148_9HYPH|nr:redox-regulated ATPase YchF [Devosia nanyangense]
MGLKIGIVGLPNVGKSTLFNALTRTAAAQAANFPFCTIEPNIGEVAIPDARLEKLARVAKSQHLVPARMSFVDIAGLVKGASKGEGLGNQFLGNIRECDAVIYVLRCFDDPNVIHVANAIDPISDAEVVETELMLADLESLEKRVNGLDKRAKQGDKEARISLGLVNRALALLRDGKSARLVKPADAEEEKAFRELQLLTAKPALYVCNVDEASAATGNEYSKLVEDYARTHNAGCVVISAEIESQLAQLPDAEEAEFLATLGLDEPALNKLIREGYKLLGLQTYFTAGPKEARAWTIHKGDRAPQAAGVIHSDFERGFIRAQTIAFDDYIALGGEVPAKEAGKARDEGKEYVVKDGDVMLFRFNT